MTHNHYPKGAGLGRDADRRKPGLVDFDFTLQHGSRAQRREIVRMLKQYKRAGVPGAAEAADQAELRLAARSSRHWRVRLDNGLAFDVFNPTPCTAMEVLKHYPGAIVEALHD